jgi:hypothetical protein
MDSANPFHMLRMLRRARKPDIDVGQVRGDAWGMVKYLQGFRQTQPFRVFKSAHCIYGSDLLPVGRKRSPTSPVSVAGIRDRHLAGEGIVRHRI